MRARDARLGRLRATTWTPSATLFALRAERRARAGLRREALHDGDGAAAPRARARRSTPRAVSDGDGRRRAACCSGDLVLVGAGDPFFGAEAAAKLARAVRGGRHHAASRARSSATRAASTGRRSGCCSGYDPDLGGVLERAGLRPRRLRRAPAARRGRCSRRARFAGAAARRRRDAAPSPPRAGTAPPGAGAIAVAPSLDVRDADPLRQRAVEQLRGRDAAEGPRRALPRQRHDAQRRRGRARHARADRRAPERSRDGSGLSRSNRTTPRDVVRLLERMDLPDVSGVFRASLAVAGQTGTVKRRMRGTAAAGRCRVKTGTLRDVSALAGYCRTRRRPRRRLRAAVQPRATRSPRRRARTASPPRSRASAQARPRARAPPADPAAPTGAPSGGAGAP